MRLASIWMRFNDWHWHVPWLASDQHICYHRSQDELKAYATQKNILVHIWKRILKFRSLGILRLAALLNLFSQTKILSFKYISLWNFLNFLLASTSLINGSRLAPCGRSMRKIFHLGWFLALRCFVGQRQTCACHMPRFGPIFNTKLKPVQAKVWTIWPGALSTLRKILT